MRAESGGTVKGYQQAGLVEDDDELDIAEEIVERTTHPRSGQTMTQLILQSKQDAMDRLKAAQDRLTQRRAAQQQRAEQDRWFALAQGMLAPTRTGGFGEALGSTAGLMRQQQQMAAEQEAALAQEEATLGAAESEAEAQMIDQLLEQQKTMAAGGADPYHGSIQTMEHPDDVNKPLAQRRLVFGVLRKDTGQMEMIVNPATGQAFQAADKLDPARAAAIMSAAESAKADTKRSKAFIETAYASQTFLNDSRRAIEILMQVDPDKITTSGIQALKTRVGNLLGISFGDTEDLTELQMIIAQDYVNKLTGLKGSSSDRDVIEMKAISAGIGQLATPNFRQLKRMERGYLRVIEKGIREAYKDAAGTKMKQGTGDFDAVKDLWPVLKPQVDKATGERLHYQYVDGAVPAFTREEYEKLPDGTKYFTEWGGMIREKGRRAE